MTLIAAVLRFPILHRIIHAGPKDPAGACLLCRCVWRDLAPVLTAPPEVHTTHWYAWADVKAHTPRPRCLYCGHTKTVRPSDDTFI